MLEIRTNLFRKDYPRTDGKKQLKVLVKIIDNSVNTFRIKKRYEIKILKNKEIYTVTDAEYQRLKTKCEERLSLDNTQVRIKYIIPELLAAKVKLSNQVIHDKLYEIENKLAENENLLKWNELLDNYSKHDTDATNEDIANLEHAMIELTAEQGTITDQDISDIFDSIKFDASREKHLKRIGKMSLNERYLKGHFDKNSIIEVFGYCWSTNVLKNEPYIGQSYKSLILQLADYIYNSKTASPKITDFNHQWVDNFHTGYNLECISDFIKFSRDNDVYIYNLDKGFKYYINTFFTEEGIPKYYNNSAYPIDVHAPAQMVITLTKLGKFQEHKAIMDKVLSWTIKNMQSEKGFFYYQVNNFFSSKIPYMRWAQAWMFYALSTYTKFENCEQD